MAQALLGMELNELREALGPEQPEFRSRQVYEAIYHGQVTDLVKITTLPGKLRERLASGHPILLPASKNDMNRVTAPGGTCCVWMMDEPSKRFGMPEDNRDTLCIRARSAALWIASFA